MNQEYKKSEAIKLISENRRARFDFHILEELEAGIVLTGAEIKSIRANGITLSESYVRPMKGEIVLIGAHIQPYKFEGNKPQDPVRIRKLLLHTEEISKLSSKVEQQGLTIVALSLYLKHGRAKLKIALAKGKNAPDKRQTIKERESKREAARAIRE